MISDIKSGKLVIKDIFKRWYKIPEYQRHYLWKREEVNALLDDINLAQRNNRNLEYFLGTIIFQKKVVKYDGGSKYVENELLDGQQRLVTLLLIIAVIRNLADGKLKEKCKKMIYQEGDEFDEDIPERVRIVFDIRQEVNEFIESFIKEDNRLDSRELLRHEFKYSKNLSVKNMIHAIVTIQDYFKRENIVIDEFFKYINNKVLLVYISSSSLEDSIKLFNVINDRGIKLRYIDTLKVVNLREIPATKTKIYAKIWEETENYFNSEKDFESFLSYLRMILMEEKAQNSRNLFDDFEKIYSLGLLKKGEDTFRYLEKFKKYYDFIFNFNHSRGGEDYRINNLIQIMKTVPSDLWIAPLLKFIDIFKGRYILEFLEKLDNVISYDWIIGLDDRKRKERVINIIKIIGKSDPHDINKLLNNEVFDIDCEEFISSLNSSMNIDDRNQKRIVKYLLYKLEYLYGGSNRINLPNRATIEHILPKNPMLNSRWITDFTQKEREKRVNKIGNLILISENNNVKFGNLDFKEKKKLYFQSDIEPFRHSLKVMNSYDRWTPKDIDRNQKDIVLFKFCKHYCGEKRCNDKSVQSSYNLPDGISIVTKR